MRNIKKYEDDYIKDDFEKYQVVQRRKTVLNSIYGRKKILEIGCGMEPLFLFADWDVDEFTVFEPGERFMQNAKNLAQSTKNNVRFFQKPFFADDCVGMDIDAVVCSSLLHEISKPLEMLKDICKVSDCESIIHINVPNARSFHRLLAKEMGYIDNIKQLSERNKLLQQNGVFDIEELKELCDEAGLMVIDSGSYFIKPFTHEQMKKMLDYEIIDERVIDGLYEMAKYMPEYGSEIYVNCTIK